VDQPNILPVPASHVQKLGFARDLYGPTLRCRRGAMRATARVIAHLIAIFGAFFPRIFVEKERIPTNQNFLLTPLI
jgi:hypothetical protein